MESETWHDVGPAEDLAREPLRRISVGRVKLALAYQDDQFSAISGVCYTMQEGRWAKAGSTVDAARVRGTTGSSIVAWTSRTRETPLRTPCWSMESAMCVTGRVESSH